MIRVGFDPSQLADEHRVSYERWSKRAEAALKAAQSAKVPDVEASAPVWRDFKAWLTADFFAYKCAYCEGPLAVQTSGAAEHFRPKKGVAGLDAAGKATKVTDAANEPHTGYWWLAFAWENLVPACSLCNEKKGVKFPIAGQRVFSPGEARDVQELDDLEQPLLLHPYVGDDPAEHIEFDDDGFAVGKTEKGKQTITVCGLNRDRLRKERAKAQRDALNALLSACAMGFRGFEADFEDEMLERDSPSANYSRAVCDYLASSAKPMAEKLAEHAQRRWGPA